MGWRHGSARETRGLQPFGRRLLYSAREDEQRAARALYPPEARRVSAEPAERSGAPGPEAGR